MRLDWLVRVLGGVTQSEADKRAREAFSAGYDDGNDDPATSVFREGRQGYHLASGGVREPAISWEQNLRTAWELKQANPLVNRSAQIRRDYIVGTGPTPKASDVELQRILDEFWLSNQMSLFVSEIVRQWIDYGAQVVPAFVRRTDGRVQLGYIDPGLIERVIAHPGNARQMWAVVVKPQQNLDVWASDTPVQVFRIIRPSDAEGILVTHFQVSTEEWEAEMLRSFGLKEYSGDCFYLRKNADSNQPIGRSDHLPVADYCDQYDDTMTSLAERERLANMIFANVSVDGDRDTVIERAEEIRRHPPTPGSINVFNKSEEWKLDSPKLNQTDSVATADAQRKLILGGEGIPDAWYGAPGGTHLATVTAQGDPTWRTLAHDQHLIKVWLLEILTFVRDQAVRAGMYRPAPGTDTSVDIAMPEMTVRDIIGLSGALKSVVDAMESAVQQGFVEHGDAVEAVVRVLNEMGVYPDVSRLKSGGRQ